jgi:pimeloyl-ACP methyl ester carboxylesterase
MSGEKAMDRSADREARQLDRRTALATLVAAGALASTAPAEARPRSRFPSGPGLRMAYADGPYGQIHYRVAAPESSSRLPLLCLHASPLSGIVYDQWLLEIARDRIGLAPDTPGYGSSAAPPQPVAIADYAAAMLRFMDELGLRQVDVMGYHTGSLTSIELARRHPDRVRHVVMISAPIFTAPELERLRATSAPPAASFEVALARVLENWRRDGKGMFRDATEDRVIDMRLETLRRYRTSNWGFRAAFDYDLAKTLPEVQQPVLLLNPEDDLWTMTPRAKPLLNARSRIHDLPGWTHGHLDAHTAQMAAIVRAFLDA